MSSLPSASFCFARPNTAPAPSSDSGSPITADQTIEQRHDAVMAICDLHGLEPRTPDRERIAAWAKVVRGSLAPCPVVDSPAVREQMLTARIAVEEILNRLEREMLEA